MYTKIYISCRRPVKQIKIENKIKYRQKFGGSKQKFRCIASNHIGFNIYCGNKFHFYI